jgi:hypothetical protein
MVQPDEEETLLLQWIPGPGQRIEVYSNFSFVGAITNRKWNETS